MYTAEHLVDEGAVHLHGEVGICVLSLPFWHLLGEYDDEGCALSTVPISMSAMVAAEQLVDEGAVHLVTEE